MTLDTNDNPYRPPASRVADPEPALAAATPPPLMKVALGLLLGSLVVGLVSVAAQGGTLLSQGPWLAVLIGAAIPISLMGLLIFKIWRGRNWARILLLILLLAGVPISIPRLPAMFAHTPLSAIIFVIQTVAQLGALYIVFLTPARGWFARPKSSRA